MIGQQVEHPIYGQGQIVAMYRNGTEWMVRFESGMRFRRPRQEFVGEQKNSLPVPAAPLPIVTTPPLSPSQFKARQLLESLRVGVAPAEHVQELTIGLQTEQKRVKECLSKTSKHGGSSLAVIGEYGFGKSHLLELTAQEALNQNFLVAMGSLDLQEMPAHRPFSIYQSLLKQLRYPNTDIQGLEPLLEKTADSPHILAQFQASTPTEINPLTFALDAISKTSSTKQRQGWREWLTGSKPSRLMIKNLSRGTKIPTLYTSGHNARQITFLLTGVSTLAKLAGYAGFAILIDEAESYALLRPYQKIKAAAFFQAMIRGTLRDRQKRIAEDLIPQHRYTSYPLSYDKHQSLFFLFTATHSDKQMPVGQWLEESHTIVLDQHYNAQEIGQFLQVVMQYHGQAYGYEPGDRQGQIRRGAAEHLAQGMKQNKLSIRGVVRLAVELLDLLYLHPDYEIAAVLDELRQQMK